MISFPCPVPLCRHHTEEPFELEALLKSHVDTQEHKFVDAWQNGPPPPQIDDIGTDTITLFWLPIIGASHYILQMKEMSTASSSEWQTLSSTLTSTIVKKKTLTPATFYVFRYKCRDAVWTGGCETPFSAPSKEIRTLENTVVRPTPPRSMGKPEATSLTVQWDAIHDAQQYELQIRRAATAIPLLWEHAATVAGRAVKKKTLLPKTKYEFRVRESGGGSSSGGDGVWSTSSSVMSTESPFNPFKQLLGNSLVNAAMESTGTKFSIDHLTGKKLVMLYFSASWCPPCRQFTPMLATFYNEMKAANRSLEIVFVSADRDVQSFQQYLRDEHPWMAIPYESPSRTQASGYFQVNGIPRLMVFNGSTGAIVCSNAVGQPLSSANLDSWEKM